MLIAALAACQGCDNTFTPKAEFRPQLVVYCALNPLTGSQVAIVERSYDAELAVVPVPLTEKEVSEATVRIYEGTRIYVPKDTVVMAGSARRRVWVFENLQPKQNLQYRLEVSVPGFADVFSEILVPSRAYLRGLPSMIDPGNPDSMALVVKTDLAEPTNPPHGYYLRLWITGERSVNGQTVLERIEVPQFFGPGDARSYTQPSRDDTEVFPYYSIRRAHDSIFGRDTSVRNKKLVMTGYAMDPHFYNYYKVVRGFDDPHSVRIDNPNVSYITGGLGMFGAFLADSAKYDYHFFIRQ